MEDNKGDSEILSDIYEDAFFNIKEACKRLQERTGCSDQIVIEMLDDLVEYYKSNSK